MWLKQQRTEPYPETLPGFAVMTRVIDNYNPLRKEVRTSPGIQSLSYGAISPALLFMGALAVRNLQSLQYQPARTAQRIVVWYAARQWTLWALLIALPFTVLIIGCCSLLRDRSDRVQRCSPASKRSRRPTYYWRCR